MEKYICPCGYVYDPEKGDPDNGVAPGTAWENVPEDWVCPVCGKTCKGKFCADCGAKKPASEPLYRCDKCGWEPADPKNPPKFCPECGDRFDANDVK